jgi:N-acetylglutamate synthase/N-acetylornithine aminotransferase
MLQGVLSLNLLAMLYTIGNILVRLSSHAELLSGTFTTNVVAAAPVLYCKHVLSTSKTVS